MDLTLTTSIGMKNWRNMFAEVKISLKDLKITHKGNTDLIFEYTAKQDEKRLQMYTRAASKQERDTWFKELQSAYDAKKYIKEWKNQLETKTNPKYFQEMFCQMLGVFSVSIDAKTSWEEVTDLADYLSTVGIPQHMVDLFIYIMKTEGVKHFTNDMLYEPSFNDSVHVGMCLLYIMRRLMWRFGYASTKFALAITKTEYLKILCNDLSNWTKSKDEDWPNGNYILFSSLDLIQQCARTTAPTSYFYDIGIKDVLASLIEYDSKEVKLASMIPLSHIVREEDIGLLKIDEEFLRFVLKILNQTIDNNSHSAIVNKSVPYKTNLSALFYYLGLLCQVAENKNLIMDIGIIEQLSQVSKMNTKKELLSTLYLVDALSFSVHARKNLLDDQILLEKIEILKESNYQEIAEKARHVYKNLYETVVPDSIEHMSTDSIQTYLDALKSGTTRSRNARIIFLGHAGAGKTSLCRRFLGRSIEGIKSTVGIDIFIHRFIWDLKSKKWILQKLGNEIDTPTFKLAHVLRNLYHENKQINSTTSSEIHNFNLVSSKQHKQEDTVKQSEDTCVSETLTSHNERNYISQKHYEETDFISKSENYESMETNLKAENSDKIKTVFYQEKDLSVPEKCAFVSLWDFAGEEIFYATHHIFLSPDAIYLITLDMSEIKSNAPIEKARYWLKSILTYSSIVKDETGDGFWCPPIILVGTHKDKLPGETEEEREHYANQKFKDLLDFSDISGLDTSFIQSQFVIDNTVQDPTIQVIKETLIDLAAGQLHWEKDVPSKWFLLERDLMLLKESGQKIVTLEQLKSLNVKIETPIENEDELILFLSYMHEEGILLYFSQIDALNKYIVVDPQWIVNAFKKIITTPESVKQIGNQVLRKLLKPLKNEGKLYDEYLEAVFSLDSNCKFLEYKKILIPIMERLHLISKPLTFQTHINYWFVPSMLKAISLSSFLKLCDFENANAFKTCTLCLSIKRKIIPDFVFDKLLATCLSKWAPQEKSGRFLVYRFMACFKIDNWKLILYCDGNLVQSVVFNFSAVIPERIGRQIIQFLQSALEAILNAQIWDVCFLCRPLPSAVAKPIRMSYLFSSGKVQCCDHQSTRIHHLTRSDIRQWIKMDENLSSKLSKYVTVSNCFPSLRHIRQASKKETTSQGFKKPRDTTLTEKDLDVIKYWCSSVGKLYTPESIATVFRVGPCFVMTAFHTLKEIVYVKKFSSVEINESNLQNEHIYIKFNQTDGHRFYLRPHLTCFSEELDFAILEIQPASISPGRYIELPPQFTFFDEESQFQELTAIIGYGHPNCDDRIIEAKVKLVSKYSERVRKAIEHIQLYSEQYKGILMNNNKDPSLVDYAYDDLFKDFVVPINCFMEKGSSGAPGFVVSGNDVRVVMMVTGGLPKFYWDLPDDVKITVDPKMRFEFGTSMRAIFKSIQDKDLRKAIFGE